MATVVAGAGSSAAIDLRTRRIPNTVTIPIAAAGLGLAASGISGLTLGASLTGLAVGLLLMLPGHLFGGSGAGDVKLLAALGAVLGPSKILMAFLYSAIAGGILAIGFAIARGRLRRTFGGAMELITRPLEAKRQIDAPTAGNRFPYGPAIAAGSVLVALGY